ncbi:amidohydrolase family protein [Stakelama sp. CBK3Z-3]|uniref:Amidohydrolase family protein n=1 Tax=Stakelama flava TaxID=2860338 RepID=A0ABS6XJS6_9SPHN|nr:amidohydrolase family protein [Stakelama flava]MBW4329656.1 amidohydrolase family protein [Stakelama flava]
MMAPRFGLLILALVAMSGCTNKSPTVASAATVIDHVTVLDGRGGPGNVDARVVVRDGRIVSIAPASGAVPEGAVIDGRGKFLLPGFIDMHAHLLFPRCTPGDGPLSFDRALSEKALSRELDFGITMVRSPATPTIEGLKLRDDLNAGRVRGPRALASAELINDQTLSEAQLRQIVRNALPFRPDYFKVYARLRPEQVATVIDEAHRHGIPVIGHLQRTTWTQGVALGIDHLAHSVDWSTDSLPESARPGYVEALKNRRGFRARIDWLEAFDPDGAGQRELIAALARKRISVDVTLIAYDGKFSPPDEPRYRQNPYLRAFPELRHDWERCDDVTAEWTPDDYRRWKAARPKLFAWIRKMHEGGVLLVSGTDMTNEWIVPGEGLHQEFELLAEAGLTPNQILRMTGTNAAEALKRDDVGIVEAGRRADLVLLSKDPRKSISNTRSIIWVMQGGRIVGRGRPRP